MGTKRKTGNSNTDDNGESLSVEIASMVSAMDNLIDMQTTIAESNNLYQKKIDETQRANANEFREYRKKQDSKIDKIAENLNKLEVVIVKLANTDRNIISLEEKIADNNVRTHKRINEIVEKLELSRRRQEGEGCPTFNTFYAKREEQVKKYDRDILEAEKDRERIRKEIEKIEKRESTSTDDLMERIEAIEKKPMEAMKIFAKGALTSLGVGAAGWVMLKFGLK